METALLIILPILAGLAGFAFKEGNVKYFSFGASIVVFLLSLYILSGFSNAGGNQFAIDIPWIEAMGISFNIGVDGISLLLVLLTTFLTPLIILSAFPRNFKSNRLYYFLILLMEAALIGVFVSRDAFLFYVFWELALIPIYFICLIWGGEGRTRITFKFFIYTLTGSLFMLLGIIFLYLKAGSFSITAIYGVASTLDLNTQILVFLAFMSAFAIKMPIFPFHTWQPDTYTTSPTQGTMLLSGIMLKMGIYGVIRWVLPVVPSAVATLGLPMIILTVIGIIYASIIAIKQNNIKTLIAYVSIAHVGLIAAGLFTNNEEALQGVMIQMLSHGINVVGLFFIIDIVFARTNTLNLSELGGIRKLAPSLTIFFIIILLGSVALPLTSGFVGEFLLFTGLFIYSPVLAGIAGLTIIFGAVYMLSSFQKAMLGETNDLTNRFTDLLLSEKAVLIPIVILIIFIGIYPLPFLEISEPAVKGILQNAQKAYSLR
ncbi:MAG TPA: NADH-quinone oxidoreductase subunit M [Cytophagaceae bacterium]|jgi:NADH-quinone oxidoreductase subunit M